MRLKNLRRQKKSLFQVPFPAPGDAFGGTNSYEACFLDLPSQLLPAHETPGTSPAFMWVVELWGASVPIYNNNALVRSHCYEHVLANHPGLVIGTKDMRLLMREKRTATWEQLPLSLIRSGAILQAPFDENAAIPRAALVLLPSSFAIRPICTIRFFAKAVRDLENGLGAIALRQRFCTYAW